MKNSIFVAVVFGFSLRGAYGQELQPGDLKWTFIAGGEVLSSPAIGADGTVYVGSGDKKVYALDGQSGARKWEFESEGSVRSSPAIGVDGTVYFGEGGPFGYKVYALDGQSGARKWEFETGGAVLSSPAIAADGVVYVGSNGDMDDWTGQWLTKPMVYALDGRTGARNWAFETEGAVTSSPAIGSDGTVYVGSDDGKVYAITGSSGPANSAWPMFGQNAQRTGRAPAPQIESIKLRIPSPAFSPFTFTFSTTEGASYEIQVTQDLKQWSKLGELKGTSGEVKFTDPRVAIVPFERNFYRVKLVQ